MLYNIREYNKNYSNGRALMKNNYCISMRNHRIIQIILAAVAISLGFLSCAAEKDQGSLTIALPGTSPSRSLSGQGSLGIEGMTFSVYIRDKDNNEVESYKNVFPGSTLTISDLTAGTYNIAIRGIITDIEELIKLYGTTEAQVKGGEENTANITLGAPSSNSSIEFQISGVQSGTFNAKINGSNGDSYTISNGNIYDEGNSRYYHMLNEYFFEPGFTYTLNITTYSNDTSEIDSRKTSAKAGKDGIVFYID